MERKMYPHLNSMKSPRIQFNWAFHDGAHDAVTDYHRVSDTLTCQSEWYQAGYKAGQAEVKRTCTRPDDSGNAWTAYLLSLSEVQRNALRQYQLQCEIGDLENCLHRRADDRMLAQATERTYKVMTA